MTPQQEKALKLVGMAVVGYAAILGFVQILKKIK